MTYFDENKFAEARNRLECLKLAQSAESFDHTGARYPLLSTVLDRADEYAEFVNGPTVIVADQFVAGFAGIFNPVGHDVAVVEKPTWPMNFGDALNVLKNGDQVYRAGWNGKEMFLYLVDGSTFEVNRRPLSDIDPEGTEIEYLPHIDMRTAQGSCVPWLASQTDILAEDWYVV